MEAALEMDCTNEKYSSLSQLSVYFVELGIRQSHCYKLQRQVLQCRHVRRKTVNFLPHLDQALRLG